MRWRAVLLTDLLLLTLGLPASGHLLLTGQVVSKAAG